MAAQQHPRRGGVCWIIAGALTLAPSWLAPPAQAQNVGSKEQSARILTLEKITVREGVVSGEVRNKTGHAVREVQLFIRYTWLWDDERNPGKIDPGTSTYHLLKETIAPGASVAFTFAPSPPLPKITGGRFESSVMVAGFTEVIPQMP